MPYSPPLRAPCHIHPRTQISVCAELFKQEIQGPGIQKIYLRAEIQGGVLGFLDIRSAASVFSVGRAAQLDICGQDWLVIVLIRLLFTNLVSASFRPADSNTRLL